jgi:hypothetical protein
MDAVPYNAEKTVEFLRFLQKTWKINRTPFTYVLFLHTSRNSVCEIRKNDLMLLQLLQNSARMRDLCTKNETHNLQPLVGGIRSSYDHYHYHLQHHCCHYSYCSMGGFRHWALTPSHSSEYVFHGISKCFDHKVTISLTRLLDFFNFVLCLKNNVSKASFTPVVKWNFLISNGLYSRSR